GVDHFPRILLAEQASTQLGFGPGAYGEQAEGGLADVPGQVRAQNLGQRTVLDRVARPEPEPQNDLGRNGAPELPVHEEIETVGPAMLRLESGDAHDRAL